jgi:hypothetical protein
VNSVTNMSNASHFCTIVTHNYIPWAKVLHKSLEENGNKSHLHVLVVDGEGSEQPGISFYSLGDLTKSTVGWDIIRKYDADEPDKLRWSLKPAFLHYLLEQNHIESIAYADADIYFVGTFEFLFEWTEGINLKLFPHWRPIDFEFPDEYFWLRVGGLYNAGFLMAKKGSEKALEWWARNCAMKCEQDPEQGLYDDQRYLDILPIYFDGVQVSRHQGCNVARWNRDVCKRQRDQLGAVLCGGDPLVFLHFSPNTIREIQSGKDPLLERYLTQFCNDLESFGFLLKTPQPANLALSPVRKIRYSLYNFIKKHVTTSETPRS